MKTTVSILVLCVMTVFVLFIGGCADNNKMSSDPSFQIPAGEQMVGWRRVSHLSFETGEMVHARWQVTDDDNRRYKFDKFDCHAYVITPISVNIDGPAIEGLVVRDPASMAFYVKKIRTIGKN